MSKRVVSQRGTPSVHQEHELLCRLETAGMTDTDAQAVIQSKGNALAKQFVDVVRGIMTISAVTKTAEQSSVVIKMTSSQEAAKRIMGGNFLAVGDVAKYFAARFTDKQLAALVEVPFDEATLRACKNSHILCADFGLSVMDVWEQHAQLFYSKANPWYGEKDQSRWARKRVKAQWRLLRKDVVPNSFSKDLRTQEGLLGKGEEIPEVREMVYVVIGHYLATGEKLFPTCYARTKSLSGAGDRVSIGYFNADGLSVSYWHDLPYDDVGLASSGLPAEARRAEAGSSL